MQSLGTVLLRVDDHDYQGDSRLLYDSDLGCKVGLLIFGWGSCSGCDALQACDNYDNLQALADKLQAQIIWKTKTEMLAYLKEHDWEGDFSYCNERTRLFVELAIRYLENL